LRAPLVAIEGFSQLLMEGDGALEGEVARKYLERVRRASRRMRDLIDNMLKLSRISFADLSLQRIDLSWMASDILKELSFASPERRVRIDIEPDIFAEADAGLIRIALENLLGNAWKYSAHHKAAHIEFGKRTENGEEVLFVRDNGVGFDMAHADKLFTPFQRLHPDSQFSGTGVGLATVRRVVDRHQGRIWAEGVPGEGASFYFTLDAGSRG
jgi:signal transduction histidine kinase